MTYTVEVVNKHTLEKKTQGCAAKSQTSGEAVNGRMGFALLT